MKVAIDAETGLDSNFPEHGSTPPPVCWSISKAQDAYQMKASLVRARPDPDVVGQGLLAMLQDDNVMIIGQNIGFDLLVAWQHHGVPIERIFDKLNKGLIKDTQVRQRLLDISDPRYVASERPVGLDHLVKRHLNIDIAEAKHAEDAWRLRYWELVDLPISEWPSAAVKYAKDDACLTYLVYDSQQKTNEGFTGARVMPQFEKAPFDDYQRGDISTDESFQLRADISLKLMARHSFHVDHERVKAFRAEHQAIVNEVEQDLVEGGILKWNKQRFAKKFPKGDPRREGWSVSKQRLEELVKADCEAQGVKPLLTLKTKKIALDSDALRGVEDPLLKKYAKVQNSRKLLNTFVSNLEDAGDYGVKHYYDVLKKTGRTSCSKFPLHQFPRAGGARECLIPPRRDQGMVLVGIDYEAFEMCALAQVNYEDYGVSTMKRAIDEGQDLHCVTAANLMGYSLEEFMEGYKRGDKRMSDLRQGAKAYNFGAPGGMMETTFIKTLSDEDRAIIRSLSPSEKLGEIVRRQLFQWRRTWDMQMYFEDVQQRTAYNRRFTYVHPWSGRIRSNLGYSDGLNIKFQGRCADAAKNAMWMLTENCYRSGMLLNTYGVRMVAFIHDEFVFEGPAEGIDEWVAKAIELMIEGAQEVIPDVTIRAGAEVMPERWAKKGMSLEEFKTYEREHR